MQFSVLSSKNRDLQHWGRKKIRSTDIGPRFVHSVNSEKLGPKNVHLENNDQSGYPKWLRKELGMKKVPAYPQYKLTCSYTEYT